VPYPETTPSLHAQRMGGAFLRSGGNMAKMTKCKKCGKMGKACKC